jgi:hypothetical protein
MGTGHFMISAGQRERDICRARELGRNYLHKGTVGRPIKPGPKVGTDIAIGDRLVESIPGLTYRVQNSLSVYSPPHFGNGLASLFGGLDKSYSGWP